MTYVRGMHEVSHYNLTGAAFLPVQTHDIVGQARVFSGPGWFSLSRNNCIFLFIYSVLVLSFSRLRFLFSLRTSFCIFHFLTVLFPFISSFTVCCFHSLFFFFPSLCFLFPLLSHLFPPLFSFCISPLLVSSFSFFIGEEVYRHSVVMVQVNRSPY